MIDLPSTDWNWVQIETGVKNAADPTDFTDLNNLYTLAVISELRGIGGVFISPHRHYFAATSCEMRRNASVTIPTACLNSGCSCATIGGIPAECGIVPLLISYAICPGT